MEVLRSRRENFYAGMRDGIPIALGYLAVSFTLSIACRNIGMGAVETFVADAIFKSSDKVPRCAACRNGLIRPDVTLYGESLPPDFKYAEKSSANTIC